jgi:Cu(I)/Ag(I) efflux system membrane protein CusA/SilA
MTTEDVQAALSAAVGGAEAGRIIEGRNRFSVLIRYPRELRDDPQKLGDVLIATPRGAQVPLAQVAQIGVTKGATLIKSEDAALNEIVYVDVRDRDVGSYVDDARALVRPPAPPSGRLPAGWSGQFEAMQRAAAKLRIVVPITLAIILLLLYANFCSMTESLIIMLSVGSRSLAARGSCGCWVITCRSRWRWD